MKSSIGAQVAPPLVVFQIPPPTPPANIVAGVAGLIASDRIRPPMLPGPSHRHAGGETALAAAAGAAAWPVAVNRPGSIGAAGADSSRRTAPPHFSRSTCDFALVYAFGGMRPKRSASFITRKRAASVPNVSPRSSPCSSSIRFGAGTSTVAVSPATTTDNAIVTTACERDRSMGTLCGRFNRGDRIDAVPRL